MPRSSHPAWQIRGVLNSEWEIGAWGGAWVLWIPAFAGMTMGGAAMSKGHDDWGSCSYLDLVLASVPQDKPWGFA